MSQKVSRQTLDRRYSPARCISTMQSRLRVHPFSWLAHRGKVLATSTALADDTAVKVLKLFHTSHISAVPERSVGRQLQSPEAQSLAACTTMNSKLPSKKLKQDTLVPWCWNPQLSACSVRPCNLANRTFCVAVCRIFRTKIKLVQTTLPNKLNSPCPFHPASIKGAQVQGLRDMH